MNKRYDYNDFQAIVEKKVSIEQIAEKYNTTIKSIHRQMNRAGFYLSKRKIVVCSPYKKIVCSSIYEVANQLGISHTSVINALKGKEVRVLQELEITIKEEK